MCASSHTNAQHYVHNLCMCIRCREGIVPVVLEATHINHPAAFSFKELQKALNALPPRLVLRDAYALKDERQTLPTLAATLWPEHRMRAQDVEFRRKSAEHQLSRELLYAQHIDKKR